MYYTRHYGNVDLLLRRLILLQGARILKCQSFSFFDV